MINSDEDIYILDICVQLHERTYKLCTYTFTHLDIILENCINQPKTFLVLFNEQREPLLLFLKQYFIMY